jgi:hypothetical protein
MYEHLSSYITHAGESLPLPYVKQTALLRNAISHSKSSVIQELLEQMESASSGMERMLRIMGDAYCADPSSQLETWQQSQALTEILRHLCTLPIEAGAGHLRVKNVMPAAIDLTAAHQFMALVLLSATRILFFAERKGIDNFQSAVDARGLRYGHFLSPEERLPINGFLPLCSLLNSPRLAMAIYTFASRIWAAFPSHSRPFTCLASTHELLLSMGNAGASSNED